MGEAQGSKCELKIWQEKTVKDGKRETIAVPKLGGVLPNDAQYAIVVRQFFSQNNSLEKTTLAINSTYLLKVFSEIVGSHPTVAANFKEPFEMEAPFQMLYHFWEELLARREDTADDDERMHLGLLFEYMDMDMGSQKRTIDKNIHSGQINFDTLWAIFRPGELVITYTKEHPWLFRVTKTAYEENKKLGPFLEIHCTFTDYDGINTGESDRIFRIIQKLEFAQKNPAKIADLTVVPRRLAKHDELLEETLVERGSRFMALRGVSVQQYSGLAERLVPPPSSYWDPDMEDFDLVWLAYTEVGRVIIDHETFHKDNYQKPASPRANLPKSALVLCPPFVYGFSIARQEWCRFYLPNLREVDWKPSPFDSLVLPSQQLQTIHALVSAHAFPARGRDQSEQKGEGLVILLHGPPGSGKTLTAECAAEATKKALLVTSLHQLNKENEPYFFEYRLKDILRLATIWKAVVLFDEADVFLEARGGESDSVNGSSSRNALVAIFLHHLEYFSGIVFLTTNRINVFDAAMKSRLHLALGYSSPGEESRRRLWAQSFAKIPADEIDIDIENQVPEFAREKYNGREISNLVKTACTLSRFEKVPLSRAHIDSIMGMWRDFELGLSVMRRASSRPIRFNDGLERLPVRQGSILSEEPEEL